MELGKLEEPSSVDSMEPCDEVPSGIPMEVEQDADANEQKNEKEESCSTTMEEANEKVSYVSVSSMKLCIFLDVCI